jgi:hypothetical protein
MALTKQTASLVAVIQAWMMMIHKILVKRYAFARLPYGPMLARDRERMANLNFIYNTCEIESIQMLRMGRGPFYELVKRFREGGLLKDSIHTSVEEQVCIFLHVVGHNQRFRVIHSTFRRSIETISRYFKQVLYAIGELRHEMIKPPTGQTPAKIRDSFRWYPYFKVSIGLFVQSVLRNVRTEYSLTVLAICRTVLAPSMVLTSQLECPKNNPKLSEEGSTTPARMCLQLWILI